MLRLSPGAQLLGARRQSRRHPATLSPHCRRALRNRACARGPPTRSASRARRRTGSDTYPSNPSVLRSPISGTPRSRGPSFAACVQATAGGGVVSRAGAALGRRRASARRAPRGLRFEPEPTAGPPLVLSASCPSLPRHCTASTRTSIAGESPTPNQQPDDRKLPCFSFLRFRSALVGAAGAAACEQTQSKERTILGRAQIGAFISSTQQEGSIMKRLLLGTALGLFLGVTGQAKADYMFRRLDPPDSSRTEALGINSYGHIVGNYEDVNHIRHGFLLIGDCYTPFDVPDSTLTGASGINDSDEIVGRQ